MTNLEFHQLFVGLCAFPLFLILVLAGLWWVCEIEHKSGIKVFIMPIVYTLIAVGYLYLYICIHFHVANQ